MNEPAAKKPTIRHVLAVVVLVLVVAGIGVALSLPDSPPEDPLQLIRPQLMTNRPAPDFSLPDREGRQVRLSELRGRPVVLNFWSSDCPPCVEELPSLARLDRTARRSGDFSVVTVSVDDGWDQVSRLFDGETDLTVLFDPERSVVTQRYGTELFPETFLIDSEGNVRARADGQRNWSSPEVLRAIMSLRSRE